MSRSSIFIGNLDGEGAFNRSSMLGGFNTESGISMSRNPMVQDLPGRRIDTSHVAGRSGVTMDDVMRARRAKGMDLGGPSDPGLSGRGRVGAPGRGARPATRGLEGRGASAAGRRRPMPGPRGGTGRGLEVRGARPAPGTRMAPGPMYGPGRGEMIQAQRSARERIMANIEASRAGNRASNFRNAQGFIGVHGPTRKDLVKMRIADSAAGRTGGFKRSGVGAVPRSGAGSAGAVSTAADVAEGAMHGPGRAELEAIKRAGKTNTKQPIMKGMKNKKALLIGAGAAVIGGLAYSGRRGEGSSGGRTSQYRY